jgi:alpha-tubulin suppressor-like RCC1 family protein
MAGLTGLINYAVITNEKQIVNIAKSSYGAYLTDSIGNIYNISVTTNINDQNTNLWIPAISANVANIKMIDTNTGGGVFTIDIDGRLFSSGTNAKGQLGLGDILTYTNLTLVQSNLTNISVTNVFCGNFTTFCTSREYESNLDNILNNVIN